MNTLQLFLIFTLFSNLVSATFNQLAFSGGGAFGAVEIGILKRINELNPKKYDMYTGISAGGLNSGFLSFYDDLSVGIKRAETLYSGMRIEELFPDMAYNTITNEDGDDIGIKYYLKDIEYNLTIKYGLTPEDYLFLFDFTCSVIKEETNPRTIRSFSRQIAKDFGFGKKRTNKRTKKNKK